MMKLHEILIGLALSLVLVVAVGMFYNIGATEYSKSDYDSETFDAYEENVDELNDIVNKTKNRIEAVQANPLIPDAFGVIVVGGIGAANTAATSVDLFGNVILIIMNLLPVGPIGATLVAVLLLIVIIALFIAIVLHSINKSDRL